MNIFVYVHYFAARWAKPYNQDNAVSLEEYCWEKRWKLEISVGPDNETQKDYTDRKRNYTLENCCKSSGYSTKMKQISNRKTSGCQMPELLLIQILPTRVMQEYVILTKQRISWQCACANNFFYNCPRHHCLYINKNHLQLPIGIYIALQFNFKDVNISNYLPLN